MAFNLNFGNIEGGFVSSVCGSIEYRTQKVVLTVLKKGAHFGEISLIDDKPRSASIICKEVCEFSAIDKASFERVLVANPQLALSVMKGWCSRLRAADRSIGSLALMGFMGVLHAYC